MIIQINKYDPDVFKFAQLYLRVEEDQWLGTPLHRLVSYKFLKDLDDGKLDSNRYDIKYNPVYFDGEECLILLRYYNTHKDMHKHYDKHVNISRLYSELGPKGSIFKKNLKSKKNKSGGRKYLSFRSCHNTINIL